MSQTKYTEATTLASIVTSELDSLANDTAALISTELSNDASTERDLFANFAVTIATQGSARNSGASNKIHLLVVPEGLSAGVYTDAIVAGVDSNYIARDVHGEQVTWTLDDATTDRELTWPNVRIPNCDYSVGLLNESSQALAAQGNIIYMSGTFSETYA